MPRTMNFNSRNLLAFVAPGLLFLAALTTSIWSLVQTQRQFDRYIETEQALANGTREMYAQGLQMGQALRNILLDPENPKAYQNLETARADFGRAHEAALLLARDTPAASALSALADLRGAQARAQDQVLALLKTDRDQAVQALNAQETPAWRALKAELLRLRDELGQISQETRQAVNAKVRQALWLTLALAGLAMLAAMALGWMVKQTLRREIGGDPAQARDALHRIAGGDLAGAMPTVRDPKSLMGALVAMQSSMQSLVAQVRSATDSINTASSEIASGNQDLSARTEQAASNLEETAASMEELTSTVSQSADAARQANQLAASASEVAVRGGQVVSQVVTTMEEINHSSKKINDIIGVIDGIAFQTNILALNAAVEAARAGEQGRGFAVVASEVRSLAQRSAEAAKEIKGLIGTSVDKVDAGTRLVAEAGQTMSEIVGSVQRVSDIIGEITAASGEQSSGISQVNTAVNQLDQMTQQNAALVEQSAAAAESLKDQAVRLAQVVQVFRLDETRALSPVAGSKPLHKLPPPAQRVAHSPVAQNPALSSLQARSHALPGKNTDFAPQLVSKPAATSVAARPAALPKPSSRSKPQVLTKSGDEGEWESF
jgi:methyl-accepting chemotaxis protein